MSGNRLRAPRRLLSAVADLARQAALGWAHHDASSMGAAIAFYAVFSIAPMLVIAVSLIGPLLGTDTVRSDLLAQMKSLMGSAGASAVANLASSTNYMGRNRLAAVAGIATFVIGATSAFVELQQSLSCIWGTQAKPAGGTLWHLLRSRVVSFGLVLSVGILLLVSRIISARLDSFAGWLGTQIGNGALVLHAVNLLLSLSMSTLVFALVFKLVPGEIIAWADVWVGGLVTAVLFSIGNAAIVFYLGRNVFASAYGTAAAFVVLLLWVYYSAQILLFGAEFTRAYSYTHGTRAGPAGRRPARVASPGKGAHTAVSPARSR
jgi:membrane protein